MKSNIIKNIKNKDLIINNTLLKNLDYYLTHLKIVGILCTIILLFSLIIIYISHIYCFTNLQYKNDNPIAYYMTVFVCFIIMITSIALFISGIKMLRRKALFKKDIDNKDISIIYDSINKVKIESIQIGRYSGKFRIISMNLYINDIILIIPFSKEMVINRYNIKQCCEKCKNIKSELKYLSKSKIVIDGYISFEKLIQQHLLKY